MIIPASRSTARGGIGIPVPSATRFIISKLPKTVAESKKACSPSWAIAPVRDLFLVFRLTTGKRVDQLEEGVGSGHTQVGRFDPQVPAMLMSYPSVSPLQLSRRT